MAYVLEVDYQKCTGCQSCTVACALKRERICSPVLGRIQVVRSEAEGIHVPVLCQQCEDAPCKSVCPTGALTRDAVTQVISINYNRCVGCHLCVFICPFGAMLINPDTGQVFKCDYCDGDPMCVKFCQFDAIRYVPVTQALYNRRLAGSRRIQELVASAT